MSPAPSALNAYVSPFAAFVAIMLAGELLPPAGRTWSYAGQILVCGALLIRFWSVYQLGMPKKVVFTLFVAILMLIIWVLPQMAFHQPFRFQGFDPSVFKDRPSLYAAVVAVRFLRLAVVVPFVEEIFWRGFLLRYLIREEFETVPPGTFSRLSFCVVTIGFCLEHLPADYPAALVAGALFNLVYYRARSLGSCILAHAVANFLLGIYIMHTGQWGFW